MSCATYRFRPALRKGRKSTNPPPSRSTATSAALGGTPPLGGTPARAASLPPVEAWFQTLEPTSDVGCDRRARAAIRSLLAGRPRLQPVRFDTYAEWASVITIMAAAYGAYGSAGARSIYTTLAVGHPQLAALADLPARGWPTAPGAPHSPGALYPRCANGGELLHGILPIGVTLLTGRPGSGTTWLALQWALATARAHTLPDTNAGFANAGFANAGFANAGFAGAPPPNVLYLALDDGAAAIARRLALLKAPANLHFTVDGQRTSSLSAGLMALCSQMPALDLVVVDSLTTFLGPDPSAAAVADALARLHLLAMAGRSAILLVDHHTYPAGLAVPPAPAVGDANLDPDLDTVPDEIVEGLLAADAARQIETVYRLSRPAATNTGADGSDAGLEAILTALDSPIALVLPRHPDLNSGSGVNVAPDQPGAPL